MARNPLAYKRFWDALEWLRRAARRTRLGLCSRVACGHLVRSWRRPARCWAKGKLTDRKDLVAIAVDIHRMSEAYQKLAEQVSKVVPYLVVGKNEKTA